MRLEHIPIILGALVGVVGLLLLADAWLGEQPNITVERRRRQRAERHRAGEALVGLGVLLMAAALIGRDAWRYGTLAVLVGGALMLVGAMLNWRFLHELFAFRGPARRAVEGEEPIAPPTAGAHVFRPPERRKQPR